MKTSTRGAVQVNYPDSQAVKAGHCPTTTVETHAKEAFRGDIALNTPASTCQYSVSQLNESWQDR